MKQGRGEAGSFGERLRRLAAAASATGDDAGFAAEVLALRARRLAAPRDDRDRRPAGIAVLCFGLGGESYAVPLDDLAEALPLAAWTPVPGMAQLLLGVTNVRGEIRPVINLHSVLSLPEPAAGAAGYAVFLRGDGRIVGLRVESLDRIRFIDAAGLTRPSEAANGLPQRFVAGITPDTVVLLDSRQILGLDLLQDRRMASRAAPQG